MLYTSVREYEPGEKWRLSVNETMVTRLPRGIDEWTHVRDVYGMAMMGLRGRNCDYMVIFRELPNDDTEKRCSWGGR